MKKANIIFLVLFIISLFIPKSTLSHNATWFLSSITLLTFINLIISGEISSQIKELDLYGPVKLLCFLLGIIFLMVSIKFLLELIPAELFPTDRDERVKWEVINTIASFLIPIGLLILSCVNGIKKRQLTAH